MAAKQEDVNTGAGTNINVVASGFLHLLASQLSTRVITFILNLLVARYLPPQDYALASVQFHLITTTILLLSREGFRRGCLRFGPTGKDEKPDNRRVLAVAWLVVPTGLAVASLVCWAVLGWSQQWAGEAYRHAVLILGCSTALELLVEPFFILSSMNLDFRLRMAVDTTSLITKSLVTLLLITQTSWPAAVSLALAQMAMSGVIALGYGLYGLRQLRQPGACRSLVARAWGPIERQVMWTCALFSLQSAEKLLLAEGSKLVLVTLQARFDQGVYGLVANLGSLVVRLLFSPLEEVAFTAFSRFQAQSGPDPQATQRRMAGALAVMTKLVAMLGLLALAFGPSYSYTALRLVYSTRWSETEAPAVLGCYCAYIMLLAVNGISEAFVHGVMDQRYLRLTNVLLIVFSAMHLAACVAGVKALGAAGLVLADAANMLLRIAFSLWYIRKHFAALKDFSLLQLLPSGRTLVGCAGAAAVVACSKAAFMQGVTGATDGRRFLRLAAAHVGVGVCCLACLLLLIYKAEKSTLKTARELGAGKRKSS